MSRGRRTAARARSWRGARRPPTGSPAPSRSPAGCCRATLPRRRLPASTSSSARSTTSSTSGAPRPPSASRRCRALGGRAARRAHARGRACSRTSTRRHPLPRARARRLLRGHAHRPRRAAPFETEADLDRYCYQVAGTVGLMMAALLGTRDPRAARPAAAALGMAMQRTNILRDIDEDARATAASTSPGRPSRASAARSSPGAREALLRDQIARADALYDAGLAGIRAAAPRPRARSPPRPGCTARSCARSSARATARGAGPRGRRARRRKLAVAARRAALRRAEVRVGPCPDANPYRARRAVRLWRRLPRRCVVLVVLLGSRGCGGGADAGAPARADAERASRPPQRPSSPELPGGGRQIFPSRRIVAFYGNPADDELGELGIGSPDARRPPPARAGQGLRAPARKVLPASWSCWPASPTPTPATTACTAPRQPDAVIRRYLRAARRIDALLVLDIQPGRAAFLPEAKRLERWLREPDVGLALDPEWHVRRRQVPGRSSAPSTPPTSTRWRRGSTS